MGKASYPQPNLGRLSANQALPLPPNRLKVLNLVGLCESIEESTSPLQQICDYMATGDKLGGTEAPEEFVDAYGFPSSGIKRTRLNLILREALDAHEVECHEGWPLEDLTEGA